MDERPKSTDEDRRTRRRKHEHGAEQRFDGERPEFTTSSCSAERWRQPVQTQDRQGEPERVGKGLFVLLGTAFVRSLETGLLACGFAPATARHATNLFPNSAKRGLLSSLHELVTLRWYIVATTSPPKFPCRFRSGSYT